MNLWVISLMVLEFIAGVLVFPPCALVMKLYDHWPAGKTVRFLIWIYGKVWLAIVFPFVRVHRENMSIENFPNPGIIVVNHRSVLDAYFMGALPIYDANFTVRAWPFRLWWYTPFMHLAGYMNVEAMSWEDLDRNVRAIAGAGRHVIMFPEGHRSRDGSLGRFHSGAFKLACASGVPIIPLCIEGSDRLWPPGRLWMSPARVRMRCLGPIYPDRFDGELGHVSMRKHVQDCMRCALEEMRQEPEIVWNQQLG